MDYQNGKIYKITNCIDNEVYIGSTSSTLTKRWYEHKKQCKHGIPFKIYQYMTNIGIDKFSISLVENYPCTNKTELLRREGEFIKEQGTLNDNIAGRSHKEWYQDNKEWYIEKQKKYYENNKEKLAEYRENNKEKKAKTNKVWRENNKEKLLKKIECDICNSTVSFGNLLRHKRSKKCVVVSEESKTEHNELQA